MSRSPRSVGCDRARQRHRLAAPRPADGGFDARPGWLGWDVVEALDSEAEIGLTSIVDLRSATSWGSATTSRFDHLAELSGRLADEADRAIRGAGGLTRGLG